MKTTTTKKAFKTWLESKTPSTIVGYSRTDTNCPLGKYFEQLNNIKFPKFNVSVGENIIITDKNREIIKSTKSKPWMIKFMSIIDVNYNFDKNSNLTNRISAKKALEVLTNC